MVTKHVKVGLFLLVSIVAFEILSAQNRPKTVMSPLASFSNEWNDAKYLACNTAANAGYMSKEEREVVYILNLLHANPRLFANTVAAKYPAYSRKPRLTNLPEFISLLDTLRTLDPKPFVGPDSLCFESAKCHAITSGIEGYVGHDRKTEECKKKRRHNGECCQYGTKDPLSIVMSLLIDEKVPTLGHRFLFLSTFKGIGVSIQPHKTYGTNTVIDFSY